MSSSGLEAEQEDAASLSARSRESSDDSTDEYAPEKASRRGVKRRRVERDAVVPRDTPSAASIDENPGAPFSDADPTEGQDPSASLGLPPLDPSYQPPRDLASWLSLKPPTPLALPSLITTSSPIFDKDSIFLTYAMACPPEIIEGLRMHDGQARAKRTIEGLVKLLPHDHKGLPDVVAGRGQEGAGKRKKKIRPSHNMWAYRCLTIMPNRKGTADTDYTTAEDSADDGERWGGERLIKVLRDEGAADVLVVCCRWFGGTLIGPARFSHIENTARSALSLYTTQETLEPLYTELETLDALILDFRRDLAPESNGTKATPDRAAGIPNYRLIKEVRKLENLIKVRGKTVQFLGDQVAERELAFRGAVEEGEEEEAAGEAAGRAA